MNIWNAENVARIRPLSLRIALVKSEVSQSFRILYILGRLFFGIIFCIASRILLKPDTIQGINFIFSTKHV